MITECVCGGGRPSTTGNTETTIGTFQLSRVDLKYCKIDFQTINVDSNESRKRSLK